jgi:two-component system, OmpR family, response regulator
MRQRLCIPRASRLISGSFALPVLYVILQACFLRDALESLQYHFPSYVMRILLVEDDVTLSDAVDLAANGEQADKALTIHSYDLVVLDIGLPGLSGLEVLRRLRARKARVPVMILTALDALSDRVKGLDLGADDYLTKPFDLPELEARVRALLRRGHGGSSPDLYHGGLRLDTAGRRLFYEDQPIELSARELALFELLLMREGRVVSKEHMVNHLYGWGDEVGPNAMEVYVYRVRKKLEPYGCRIRTIRGMGYLLEHGDAAI